MIDFHCHLDLYPDPAQIIAAADKAGIYVLSVTTTPKAWRQTASLAQGRKRIRTALGLHPQVAHERFKELELFEALLPRARYVGEIGLDGSSGHGIHSTVQARVFERVLLLAQEHGGRILSIHSRRAVDEVLATLARFQEAGPAILHWFSGTDRQLNAAAAMGCWFSVGPAMLRSEKGKRLASRMPRDRILTETDGPFGKTGGRPLMPTDSWIAVDQLAAIWKVDSDSAQGILKENLRKLVALLPEQSVATRV